MSTSPNRVGWNIAIRVLDKLSTDDLLDVWQISWTEAGQSLWTDAAGWLAYQRVSARVVPAPTASQDATRDAAYKGGEGNACQGDTTR